jgi:Mor family transcriptional regulator
MGIRPNEKTDRNLEFYKRWRINGESLNDLIREYDFSYPRAYVIKKRLEEKYGEQLPEILKNV